MSVLAANCPSCGAPVEFRSGSSIVLICPYCRSALARTDRGLADLGKCAEVVQSESPLKVGLRGSFQGINFELTGRAQLKHSLGGFWDEWYATFSNGWVGWLAEAQGRFYLTFYRPLNEGEFIPDWENLLPGSVIGSIKTNTPLMVQEVGKAETFAAEGEIPYKLIPGEEVRFADLAGRDGVFATIDYSFEKPRLFLGKQVSLEEIGLSEAAPQKREARRVSAVSMGCPNCGGPLDLKAPDLSERVTCPNCKSLLDVNQGNLRYLKSLRPPSAAPEFCLPIGAEGIFGGEKYRILGRMMRSVTFDIKYFWYEYLLYNPKIGFRWLVHSDNHWSFVEPVNPADVTLPLDNPLGSILQNQNLASAVISALPVTVKGQKCKYGGKDFVVFQDATATVEWVEGEFYWKVEQGEKVRAIDYIAPPQMLSQEITASEINFSLGTYKTKEEIEKAFGTQNLPTPIGIAPNQPFTGQFYYTWAALPLAALLFLAVIMALLTGSTTTIFQEEVDLPPQVNPSQQQTVFTKPFDLKGNSNIRISAIAFVNNSWADLDIDLINEQNQDVESVNIPIEYYYGTDSDGAWSEGSQTSDAILSSLPEGKYSLRIEGTWQNWQQPIKVNLKVEQNYNRGINFCCAFIILAIVPAVGLLRKWSFEGARWKNSSFSDDGEDDADSEGDEWDDENFDDYDDRTMSIFDNKPPLRK